MKIKRFPIVCILILILLCSVNEVKSQAGSVQWRSASEFIFSMGDVEVTGVQPMEVSPILRFSGFFHLQEQIHFNFGKRIGIFSGVGVRNVGMINELNDSVKIKQRVYSVGIPLALKLGNLPDGFHIAFGGEAEIFLHYKQKVFYDGEKFKNAEWFSDKVNLFNPGAFIDISSRRGSYIRFKYYFSDFLVSGQQRIRNINGSEYPFNPTKSTLFYVSIGSSIRHKAASKRPKPSGAKTSYSWNEKVQ
jgi:hypothetical protein